MKKPPPLPKIPPIVLDGFSLDVDYYVKKEYIDISDAADELPSVIEWLNFQWQLQKEQRGLKEAELERAEAQTYFDLKDGDFQRKGYGDKPTDKALGYAIDLNQKVTELKEDIAILSALADRLLNTQRSLQFKLDLVRSSEATRRKLVEG